MKTIDAIGLACPQPVILAKRALNESQEEEVLVIVDNEIATQNLTRLGESQGRNTKVETLENGLYRVMFSKLPKNQQQDEPDSQAVHSDCLGGFEKHPYVVVLSSEEMGGGDPAFGRKLMEGFIYALCEQDHLPAYVLCYNKGVALTTTNPKAIEDLRRLSSKGVEVLSCGLCLDFYQLKDKLQVGQVTNMYRICELMTTYPVARP